MWSRREELFKFIGFLATRRFGDGTRIERKITVEQVLELIEGYELSQWSPLDDREKEQLRRRIAKRNEQEPATRNTEPKHGG